MNVSYPKNHFKDAQVVDYMPFNAQGVRDELNESKPLIIVICVALALAGVGFEVLIIDGYVSYNRGRGFIGAYGYPMHVYGRRNQRYIDARNDYNASTSGSGSDGFHGGGCACACACACAGGGRAGCSQKDTYKNSGQNENQ